MDCLFCKIINGDIPSYKLYEDDKVLVFLDINPSTNGHCLVIPKKHIVTIDEVDNDLMCHILDVIKKIKILLEEKLSCEGLTICQNNGHGQEIKHLHFHLTPRYEHDCNGHNYDKSLLVNIEDVYNQIMDGA